jgi:hypothetical protein
MGLALSAQEVSVEAIGKHGGKCPAKATKRLRNMAGRETFAMWPVGAAAEIGNDKICNRGELGACALLLSSAVNGWARAGIWSFQMDPNHHQRLESHYDEVDQKLDGPGTSSFDQRQSAEVARGIGRMRHHLAAILDGLGQTNELLASIRLVLWLVAILLALIAAHQALGAPA